MGKAIQEKVWAALKDRQTWEERQRVFYALVRDGLRRRNKPFKGAADLHLPIVDNAIAKLMPYDINNTFGRERLASFTPLRGDLQAAGAQAAECLDWHLKKRSNFALHYARAKFLGKVAGRGVLCVRWDKDKKRLVFEAVDPLYFVVPKGTDSIDDADRLTHIMRLTVGQYKRDSRYNQDPDLLARIRGGDKQTQFTKDQEKQHREGLSYSTDEDEIILWRTLERVEEGWRVFTDSPCAPEAEIRAPFLLNWKWQGEPWQPYVSFIEEITDQGWYAPRGIAEKLAAFEAYGCKLWNSKADWLEYCSKPLFTQDVNSGAGTNRQNVKLAPGEVLPPGMAPGNIPEPPFALDNEINTVRQLAEETSGSPDFGVQNAENAEGGNKGRTATEWNYLGSFANQGIQYRGWISGLSEAEIYWRSWALLVQFAGDELSFISANALKVLPQQARHDQYLIEPDMTPDSWNKQARVQRAVARFQMFRADPDIDQIELKRSVIEADDPRLVKKLLIGQGVRAGEEAEDEAKEIAVMLLGYPATVNPGEDHALRLKVLFGFMQNAPQLGIPMTPAAVQRLQEHAATHVQMLQKQNPSAAKQITSAIEAVDPAVTLGTGDAGGLGTSNIERRTSNVEVGSGEALAV